MTTARFAAPALSAQSAFRALLNATARPGSVHPIDTATSAPRPLSAGVAAVALTLCDHDTAIWLDAGLRSSEAAVAWLRFHCGSTIVHDPCAAAYAIAEQPRGLPPFERFHQGTPDYPDRSTTIVLQMESLRTGPRLLLSGPGIKGRHALRATPLPDDISARLDANRSLFPCGIDLLLVTDTEVAALPRSVRLVHGED